MKTAEAARPIPAIPIDPDTQNYLGKCFSEIWAPGNRHQMAILAASWMANLGVDLESAKGIIRVASKAVKGDTANRMADVEAVYDNFSKGEPVSGWHELNELLKDAYPNVLWEQANKVFSRIGKLLVTACRRIPPNEFKIIHLKKFLSDPPVWVVTLSLEGKKVITRSTNNRFASYRSFCEDTLAQNSVIPVLPLKEHEWRALINQAVKTSYEEVKR